MKKILITGATGFLGRYLMEELANYNERFEIYCLIRPESIINLKKYPINIIEGNLLDKKSIEKVSKDMDVIIHLASVLDSSDPNLEKVNIESSLEIVRNLKKNAKLIFLSSATVTYPIKTKYADSKFTVEKVIQESKIRYTIIRPTWIYGNQSRSFEKLINLSKNSKIIPIINKSIQPVFVNDVVTLIIDAIENYENEIIEIAGKNIKFSCFIKKLAHYYVKNPVIIELPYIFFLSIYYISSFVHIKVLTKDSLLDFKLSTNVDLKVLKDKYNIVPKNVDEVLSGRLIL